MANEYVPDLVELGLGRADVVLPRVLGLETAAAIATVKASSLQVLNRADAVQRWVVSTMATSIQAAAMGHGWSWFPEDKIRDELAARGVRVDHTEVASPWGHDSFLLEPPGYHDLVRSFLA